MNQTSNFDELANQINNGQPITRLQAQGLIDIPRGRLFELLHSTNLIRQHFRGKRVDLCAITNAKSGACSQDCAFCAQSIRYNTGVDIYSLISVGQMLKRARRAYTSQTHRFCLVTSGCSLNAQEINNICRGIKRIKKEFPDLELDASLGSLSYNYAKRLKNAGLSRYNHNIETVEEFFPRICTTHTFKDRLKTLRILKKAGLEVCCGGIFGLGETPKQRLEFAFTLKDLDVDCIPLNFLNPISNTPLANNTRLCVWEILKIIAVFRFIMPDKQIRICGGREKNLQVLQPLIFLAGADAIIIGDYLTTKGAPAKEDLRMIQNLGLEVD